ncbi:Protein CBG07113 [Caenorhabditis briggsae]|uniref:Protein CBG07113 n=1 Tax=Caenorhabditis briggsae TaxID=6238 RepID=A8X3N6_CAEBR|nr:Protein CBG07113 [Caenorhabditis briggsae]CAP27246.1 Protein CBG07113 [Caenorhabditis briggsae]
MSPTSSLKLVAFTCLLAMASGAHHHHEKEKLSTDSTIAKKLDFATKMLAIADDSSSEESDATAPIVLNIFADGKKAHRANRRECKVQLALFTVSFCGGYCDSESAVDLVAQCCPTHCSAEQVVKTCCPSNKAQ